MAKTPSVSESHQKVIDATRDAEAGFATCRNQGCGKRGPIDKYLVIMYGGAVALTICDGCVHSTKGTDILIQPTEKGIRVAPKERSPILIASPDIIPGLTKRPA